jgi:3-oxoacyl-[acyl-carrier protein] reductase
VAIDLAGKVCVITGAAAGIGEALARGFASRGARVVATDVAAPAITEAAECLPWDVTDAPRARMVIEQVVAKFGRIDAFIANAGIMPRQPWSQLTPDDFRRVMAVNLDGAWHGAQAAALQMTRLGYGKIVFVSSVEVLMGVPEHVHYDASKAGIIGMTRALARAVGPQGVRVNCVMPGAVQTAGELRDFPDQVRLAVQLARRQCLPARLSPAAIEPVFAFLCSADSDSITGQVLCADHGLAHY